MTAGPIVWTISGIVSLAPALERPSRASPLVAGALIAVLAAADLAFAVANGPALTPSGHDYAPATLTACLAFGVPGALVLSRAPRIGALMLLIAVSLGLAGALTGYVVADLPGSATAIWILNWSWVPGYCAIPLLVLLLPDGELLQPRVAWACVLAGALMTLGVAIAPYALEDFPVAFGEPVNPLTVGFAPALQIAGWVVLAPCALLAVWSIVRRLRSSEQLKWIALGGVLTVALLALSQPAGSDGDLVAAAAMIPLPASIAIAVLRHGLWDVDLVINRSLVYAALTLAGVAGYVVVVSLIGELVRDTVAGIVAVALVAVAFAPLHRRVQPAAVRRS
jgi:hypothetical protein